MSNTPRTDAALLTNFFSAVVPASFARTLERERDEAVSELKAERDAHEFTFTSYTMQREENVRMVSQLDNSQAETAEAIAYYKKLEAERLELERIRDADAATITRLSQEVGDKALTEFHRLSTAGEVKP